MKYLFVLILIFFTSCGPGIDVKFNNHDVENLVQDNAKENNDNLFKFIVFDVGQGSSSLIIAPDNTTILIDGGPTDAGNNVVLPYFEDNALGQLDYMIVSHYHEDHIGGIDEVIAGQDHEMGTNDDLVPLAIYDRGESYDSAYFEEYSSAAEGLRSTPSPGDVLDFGDVSIEFLLIDGKYPDGHYIDPDNDENSKSIAILIEYDDFRILVAGDLTGGGGDPPYQTIDLESHLADVLGEVDILVVNHHGSKTSSNNYFIETIDPETVIISCGDNNDFGHPADEVMQRLIAAGTNTYMTERCDISPEFLDDVTILNDHVIIKSDGKGYEI
ncbi:MBL fold metallo-hydrolase [bacterium]|nr:MBL fold metallo-hydrolase [bacterium]